MEITVQLNIIDDRTELKIKVDVIDDIVHPNHHCKILIKYNKEINKARNLSSKKTTNITNCILPIQLILVSKQIKKE